MFDDQAHPTQTALDKAFEELPRVQEGANSGGTIVDKAHVNALVKRVKQEAPKCGMRFTLTCAPKGIKNYWLYAEGARYRFLAIGGEFIPPVFE